MNLSFFQALNRWQGQDVQTFLRLFHLKFLSYDDIHSPVQRLTGHLHLTLSHPVLNIHWLHTCKGISKQDRSTAGTLPVLLWASDLAILLCCRKTTSSVLKQRNNPVFWKKCSSIQCYSTDCHPWVQNFLQEMGKKIQNTVL